MQEAERLEFWRAIWRIYYQAYYHEILSEAVQARLMLATRIADLLTAVTASGSAVAAWAVWQSNAMSVVWVALSSTAALLSVVFQALGVRDLSKRYTESRLVAQTLRLRVAGFRNKLRITNDWDSERLLSQLDAFESEFREFLKQHPQDSMLESEHLKNHAQSRVDLLLANEIADDSPAS